MCGRLSCLWTYSVLTCECVYVRMCVQYSSALSFLITDQRGDVSIYLASVIKSERCPSHETRRCSPPARYSPHSGGLSTNPVLHLHRSTTTTSAKATHSLLIICLPVCLVFSLVVSDQLHHHGGRIVILCVICRSCSRNVSHAASYSSHRVLHPEYPMSWRWVRGFVSDVRY